MSKELQIIPNEQTLDLLERYCTKLSESSIIPKEFQKQPSNILVAILHGRELGLSDMQSLQGIMCVNGRTTVFGDTALAIVQSHPDFEWIKEWYDEKTNTAHCQIKRKKWEVVERTFSVEDSSKAELNSKEIHKKFPKRMRQMRARSWTIRDVFADALKGIGVKEDVELDELEKKEINVTELSSDEKIENVKVTEKQIQSAITYISTVCDKDPSDILSKAFTECNLEPNNCSCSDFEMVLDKITELIQ